MGGGHFRSDFAFVESALVDVDRLVGLTGLGTDSRLLDWGCGAGRLAVGIYERFGRIGLYHGVDVQRWLIAWAERHIGGTPGYRFTRVDSSNARYNPSGTGRLGIPAESGEYDVLYAYSVLSHMTGDEVRLYLGEMARLLRPGGSAFFTAFVEPDVERELENPPGYGGMRWSGPLHCVRFETGYFESMVAQAGLKIRHCKPGGETEGQSLFVVERP